LLILYLKWSQVCPSRWTPKIVNVIPCPNSTVLLKYFFPLEPFPTELPPSLPINRVQQAFALRCPLTVSPIFILPFLLKEKHGSSCRSVHTAFTIFIKGRVLFFPPKKSSGRLQSSLTFRTGFLSQRVTMSCASCLSPLSIFQRGQFFGLFFLERFHAFSRVPSLLSPPSDSLPDDRLILL